LAYEFSRPPVGANTDFTRIIDTYFGTDGNPLRDLNDPAGIDYDSWEMNRSGIEGLMRF
jgi:hypothetical protein